MNTPTHRSVRLKSILNFLAIAAPIICLIDCVVLPVASALLPFIGVSGFAHGINDQVILLIVLAVCLPVIIPGYIKHKSKRVLGLFTFAITLMFFVNFGGVELDHAVHSAIAVVAACFLIRANYENKKLLKCSCSHHHHHPAKLRSKIPVRVSELHPNGVPSKPLDLVAAGSHQ